MHCKAQFVVGIFYFLCGIVLIRLSGFDERFVNRKAGYNEDEILMQEFIARKAIDAESLNRQNVLLSIPLIHAKPL